MDTVLANGQSCDREGESVDCLDSNRLCESDSIRRLELLLEGHGSFMNRPGSVQTSGISLESSHSSGIPDSLTVRALSKVSQRVRNGDPDA
jgi:hypothetical protein